MNHMRTWLGDLELRLARAAKALGEVAEAAQAMPPVADKGDLDDLLAFRGRLSLHGAADPASVKDAGSRLGDTLHRECRHAVECLARFVAQAEAAVANAGPQLGIVAMPPPKSSWDRPSAEPSLRDHLEAFHDQELGHAFALPHEELPDILPLDECPVLAGKRMLVLPSHFGKPKAWYSTLEIAETTRRLREVLARRESETAAKVQASIRREQRQLLDQNAGDPRIRIQHLEQEVARLRAMQPS